MYKRRRASSMYWFILRSIKSIRRARRRIFGGAPPWWWDDLLSLSEYINFLNLIPTFGAITFAPNHFFRKLPAILKGKSDLFLDPIKYATTWSSLIVCILLLTPYSTYGVTKYRVLACLVGAALISPFLLSLGVGIALGVLRSFFSSLLGAFLSDSWFTRVWDQPLYKIALEPQTYRRLMWGIYFWALIYFITFLIPAGAVVVAIAAASIEATNSLGGWHSL